MKIKRQMIKHDDLTIFKISGDFAIEDIVETANYFYKEQLTNNVIYDLSEATFKNIDNEKVKEIVNITSKNANQFNRKGKTAIVTSDTFSFALSRMYEQVSDDHEHPVDHGVFKNVADALIWIQKT